MKKPSNLNELDKLIEFADEYAEMRWQHNHRLTYNKMLDKDDVREFYIDQRDFIIFILLGDSFLSKEQMILINEFKNYKDST